jgi:hypothetical protein
VHDGLGPPVPVTTPDIGVLMTPLAALNARPFPALPPPPVLAQLGLRRAAFANFFKTPTLWGVKDTAPYFHDNSAKDLDEMLRQYDLVVREPGVPRAHHADRAGQEGHQGFFEAALRLECPGRRRSVRSSAPSTAVSWPPASQRRSAS